jgi:hypothetical protein
VALCTENGMRCSVHYLPPRDGYGAHVSGGMRVGGGTGEVIVAGNGVEIAGWGMIILCAYLCSIISRNGARLGTGCGRGGRWSGGSPACAPERGRGPSAGAGWGTCGCPARAAMTSSGIRRSTSRRTTSGTGPTAPGSRPAGRERQSGAGCPMWVAGLRQRRSGTWIGCGGQGGQFGPGLFGVGVA